MTPAHPAQPGATGHLTPDQIADLAGGVLAGAQAEQAAAHVAGCPTCAGVHAQVEEVRRLLAGPPALPIPAGVAARLDAVIAEHAGAGAGADSGRAAPGEVDEVARARRRRWARALPAGLVAAAASLALAVVGAQQLTGARPGTDGLAAGGGGGSQSAAEGGRDTTGGDTTGGDTTAAVPGGRDETTDREVTGTVLASGTDYTAATLGPRATALVRGRTPAPLGTGAAVPPREAPPDSAPELRGFADPTRVSACVAALAGPGARPVLVDLARFEGRPAVIVVVAGSPETQPAPAPAYFVLAAGPACGTGTADLLATARIPA